MKLTRYGSLPGIGTFGRLDFGVQRFSTIEREWLGNKPSVSCVPAGEYTLVAHDSRKYRNTFALVGGTVSHHAEPGKPRSVCLFHAANWPHELSGCIALGRELRHVSGLLGVTHSNESMEVFARYLEVSGDRDLSISWEENDV